MMTKEADAKIEKDLADTRRIIQQTNRLMQRIDAATETFISRGSEDGRPQPA